MSPIKLTVSAKMAAALLTDLWDGKRLAKSIDEEIIAKRLGEQ